jgi:Zn-dependent oligopeptidase
MQKLVLALLVLGAFAFQTATAQSPEVKALQEKIAAELKKIDARMKLTPEQKTQLKGIIEEEDTKLTALDKEYDAKEAVIIDDMRGKMKATLTPEQQKEWAKIKEEYSARMKAWRDQQKAKAAASAKLHDPTTDDSARDERALSSLAPRGAMDGTQRRETPLPPVT